MTEHGIGASTCISTNDPKYSTYVAYFIESQPVGTIKSKGGLTVQGIGLVGRFVQCV